MAMLCPAMAEEAGTSNGTLSWQACQSGPGAGSGLRQVTAHVQVEAPVFATEAASARLRTHCFGGRLAALAVQLPVRQRAEVVLLLSNRHDRPMVFGFERKEDEVAEWLKVEPASGTLAPAMVTRVRFLFDTGAMESGSVHVQSLAMAFDSGSGAFGESLQVMLDVREESPMFRDHFEEVEPLPGQFSHRTPGARETGGSAVVTLAASH